MKDPRTWSVAQATFCHSVEEKLEEPSSTRDSAEKVVLAKRFRSINKIAEGLIFGTHF